ncbi:MAG: hypothetical protein LBE67_02545 [Kocuria palustris]|nr:hypothetical protein [Kocuria palustris]
MRSGTGDPRTTLTGRPAAASTSSCPRHPGVPEEMATCAPSLTCEVYTGKWARGSHPARPR